MITPLLATKTYIPTPRTPLVPRPRLTARLNAGLCQKLTLVSAPAGFGKTTLVSAWLQHVAHPVAWLSLGRGDNDPLQFWRYVVAALQTVDETVGEAAQAALQTSQPLPPETLVATLINDCVASSDERQSSPYVLVLDDYHVIENPTIHTSLNFLLDNLPPQLHLVITTREDPPLALPRRRGRGELVEIRVADLRFTVEEAAELLNMLAGLHLSRADIAALEKRTEGWIVGLQMAALSLQQQAPLEQHDFVAAFAGDDRYIVDYLVQEVFEHQSPRVQSFLLQTSILERLCGPLCDEVVGISKSANQQISKSANRQIGVSLTRSLADSQAVLEYLERANLFTIPLDNRRYWYRYHQLFADLLRRRLSQAADTQHVNALYQRASAWCQRQGLIAEAVSYALDGSDLEYAAALIERYVLDLFYNSEIALIHHWLKALPAELMRSHPLLQAVYASTTVLLSGYSADALELAGRWLQEAENTLQVQGQDANMPGSAGQPTYNETTGFISKFRAYLSRFRGDPPQTVILLSRQALDRLPKDERKFRSALLANIGCAHMSLGDETEAGRAFAEARQIGESSGDLFNAAAAARGQALILRKQGRLHEAAAICRDSLQFIGCRSAEMGRPIPYAGVVYVTLGEIMLEWNDVEEAERLLTRGVTTIKLLPDSIAVEGYSALAWLKRVQGESEKAFELLEQAEQLQPSASPYVAAHRLRLWLTQAEDKPDRGRLESLPHDLAHAARWVHEHHIVLESEPHHDLLKHLEQVALYRLLIVQHRLQGRPDLQPLLDCLDRQIHFAREKGWYEWTITFLILRALALQAQGHVDQAIAPLRQALTLAEPGSYVRVFLDEGAPMRQLLQETAARRAARESAEYANKLLTAALDTDKRAAKPVTTEALIEPLSPREIEVLRLIATGATNPQIAQRLFITVDTVKKHLYNIFGKLEVKNRTQATARARELGLLE